MLRSNNSNWRGCDCLLSTAFNSLNIAPGYVHIFGPTTVLTVNPYFRLDTVKYFASPNAFADQPITFGQSRSKVLL
ncbi:MAG TPA: hypothetical protein VF088_06570 [Pyrinomonadaceae bacterium]